MANLECRMFLSMVTQLLHHNYCVVILASQYGTKKTYILMAKLLKKRDMNFNFS